MHIESTTPTLARRPRHSCRRRGLILAGAIACAGLISACGSSGSSTASSEPTPGTRPVDTTQVAASIKQTLLEKRKIHATVSCPATIVAETGKTFVCTAKSHSTTTPSVVVSTPFKVTIENNRGYVTYVGE